MRRMLQYEPRRGRDYLRDAGIPLAHLCGVLRGLPFG